MEQKNERNYPINICQIPTFEFLTNQIESGNTISFIISIFQQ